MQIYKLFSDSQSEVIDSRLGEVVSLKIMIAVENLGSLKLRKVEKDEIRRNCRTGYKV